MAYWLFWQKKTTGAWKTDAQPNASLTDQLVVLVPPFGVVATATRRRCTCFSPPGE
jgi:hypothetical protein